jgi:hypothetical protein
VNLFDGMENFISDTEINIKHKISCRLFFCIALGCISVSGVTAAYGCALTEEADISPIKTPKKTPPKRGQKRCSSHPLGRLSIT